MAFIDDLAELDSSELIEARLDSGPFEKKPETIYYTRFTLDDMKRIAAISSGNTYEKLVATVIHKALDKDGNRLFGRGDKARLMRMDSDVIITMVEAMNPDMTEEEDPEKTKAKHGCLCRFHVGGNAAQNRRRNPADNAPGISVLDGVHQGAQ